MEFRDRNEGAQNTRNAAELISWWVSADYRRGASRWRDCYHVILLLDVLFISQHSLATSKPNAEPSVPNGQQNGSMLF